jgi:hypothetical protein
MVGRLTATSLSGGGTMTLRAQAFEAIEGLDVFSADDEQIGTIERVLTSPAEPSHHYLLVRAGPLADLLGSDRLYVPEEEIDQIGEDRVILDMTAEALNRPDWVTPPHWLESQPTG